MTSPFFSDLEEKTPFPRCFVPSSEASGRTSMLEAPIVRAWIAYMHYMEKKIKY